VLFLVRANEPAKGLLAIPGGFVDAGENAEDALRREVREEVGLEVEAIRYVGTFPNQYPYRGVTYPVVDIVFQARALAPESARPLDGCAALLWRKLDTLDDAELAFPSIRAGRRLLTAGLGGG
jgi:ADP-ribose pyrophosphatase YjhB (NUDIX family)